MMGQRAAKRPRNAAKIGDGIQPAHNAGWGLNSDFWPEYLPLNHNDNFSEGLLVASGEYIGKKRKAPLLGLEALKST